MEMLQYAGVYIITVRYVIKIKFLRFVFCEICLSWTATEMDASALCPPVSLSLTVGGGGCVCVCVP